MAEANIKIDLSEDAFEVFLATRIQYCKEVLCEFHNTKALTCELKRIVITYGGNCQNFLPKPKTEDK